MALCGYGENIELESSNLPSCPRRSYQPDTWLLLAPEVRRDDVLVDFIRESVHPITTIQQSPWIITYPLKSLASYPFRTTNFVARRTYLATRWQIQTSEGRKGLPIVRTRIILLLDSSKVWNLQQGESLVLDAWSKLELPVLKKMQNIDCLLYTSPSPRD